MTIEQWQLDPTLKKELDEHYKTAFSLSLKDRDSMDIARALTFDGLSETLSEVDLKDFLVSLGMFLPQGSIRGVGLEIGSGPGTFVGALATLTAVTRVYGVEACEAIVRELMTKVVTHIALEDSSKVVGAVGDFDHLDVPDSSVDFVFDFFSLHHSPNPAVTIKELHRVLKRGGVVICVDKARANRMSEKELDALLDVEYPVKTKLAMGLPPDVRHTRRMNGEHEYRMKDWKKYFNEAGFAHFEHYNMAKQAGNPLSILVKKMVAIFPIYIQKHLTGLFSRRITNNLEPSNRLFIDVFPQYPREFSLMIARK